MDYYSTTHPALRLVDRATTSHVDQSTNFLYRRAYLHDYAILNGRKITPSRFNGTAHNSIVQVFINETWYVGEVVTIMTHRQPSHLNAPIEEHLINVRWFVRSTIVDTSLWSP